MFDAFRMTDFRIGNRDVAFLFLTAFEMSGADSELKMGESG